MISKSLDVYVQNKFKLQSISKAVEKFTATNVMKYIDDLNN